PADDRRAKLWRRVADMYFLAFLPDASAHRFFTRHHIRARIDQNRGQARVVVGVAVQEEDACLGGDSDTNLVGKLQTATSFEVLLGQEHLGMTAQLAPIRGWEARIDRYIPLDDPLPRRRERQRAQALSTATLEEVDHSLPLIKLLIASAPKAHD